jgi:hypothetical protein
MYSHRQQVTYATGGRIRIPFVNILSSSTSDLTQQVALFNDL